VSFLPVYLDASALVKLVLPERETDALVAALERWPDRVSSALSRVEVFRALHRAAASKSIHDRAAAVLEGLVLTRLDEPVLERAGSFKDPQLRTLAALQLAAALSLGDDPDAFITYDARLARAALREGLQVLHPGATRLD
jgi:predicted nucleic acid-binding protein